jgi:alpha-tubulin suppressor-like RCC1 family protein/sugar lactone lactonase YvrE
MLGLLASAAIVTVPGDATARPDPPPEDVTWSNNAVSPLDAGTSHTCAITPVGTVRCWGANGSGQLGDGTTVTRTLPVEVAGLGEPIDGLAAGEVHTCALTRSRLVKCWGAGGNGQLGDGTGSGRATPTPVLALDNVVSLDSGNWYACAVTAAGAVWCWGDNANGQLGDGTTTQRLAPVNVLGLAAGAVSVATGHYHACALLDDGTVRCWGDNAHGQVGDGTQTPRLVPVQVAGLTDAVAIAAGFMHTCALTAGGAVRCWGANDHGQLGDGTTTMRLTPVAVSGLSIGAVALAAGDGDSHTCAVMGDGTPRCWGANTNGQLGDGTLVSRPTPVPVPGLSDGLRVTAGKTHTCALTSAGAVTCWGDDSAGQLGDGTLVSRTVPIPVAPVVPPVTWPTPAPIPFGTVLSAVQLNASSGVAGGFTYDPPTGTLLDVGSRTLRTTFTPDDTISYTPVSASVTLVVTRAVPTLTWDEPAPIVYGARLSSTELNATVSPALVGAVTVGTATTETMGPVAVAADAAGAVYVAEYRGTGGRLLKIPPTGGVQTVLPSGGFYGVAVAPDGTVYASQIHGHRILKVTPAGGVSVLAGGTRGSADGIGAAAQFYYPCGLALDAAGLLYVADRDNHRIRRIDPATGEVTTVAGSSLGYADGSASAARFNTPWGVALDSAGTIYVADSGNFRIRTISPAGEVTTLAGSVQGLADGIGATARFATPWGVAVDAAGLVYVADASNGNGDFFWIGPANNHVRLVSPGGLVTTLAGSTSPGYADGAPPAARFNGPRGIAVGPAGTVYVADEQNNRVRTVSFAGLAYTPPAGTLLDAGPHLLSVAFTPADSVHYAPASATTPLTVEPARPAITWAAPSPVTHGTPLSAAQLTATASVPGTFAYTPPAGTVLDAGLQTLSVTFTPTDGNYAVVTTSVALLVTPATPEVTWTTPAPIAYGTLLSAAQLTATASVPGTFAYTPPAGTMLAAGPHTLSVIFSPSDAANYTPSAASVTLVVLPAPRLAEIPGRLRVGATNTLIGSGFTPGSVINLWVATASGVSVNGPLVPAASTPTALVWEIPAEVALGNGFASLQVINTDEGYTTSNVVSALLEGDPGHNIPTILAIDDEPLAAVTPGVNLAHVDTVIAGGATVTLVGMGFSSPLVNLFTADGNIGPLVPLPGGTASVIQVRLPASAPVGPANFQVVNAPFAGTVVSNAVSAVIGSIPEITRVEVAGTTVTVIGLGFSRLSVINLYNRQGTGVVNLGGFGPLGPNVPLTFVDDTRFSFTRPAGAAAGNAFLEVLNPPFIRFSSSGNDPDGGFVLP